MLKLSFPSRIILRNRGCTTFIFLKVIKLKCRLITVFLPLKRDGVSQTFNIATIVEK